MRLYIWQMRDGMVFFTAEKKMLPFFEGAAYIGWCNVTVVPA